MEKESHELKEVFIKMPSDPDTQVKDGKSRDEDSKEGICYMLN